MIQTVLFNKLNHFDYFIGCILFVITLAIMLYNFQLPGLYHDEVGESQRMASFLAGQLERPYHIPPYIDGFSLMTDSYVGAFHTYFIIPFYAIFGIGLFAERVFEALIGGFIIFVSYFFTKNMFDRKISLLSCALLISTPFFIFEIRNGSGYHPWLILFQMLTLHFSLLYLRTKKNIFLMLTGIVIGIGIWSRIDFFWFLTAFIIIIIVIRPKICLNKKRILLGISSVSLGAFAFILYTFLGFYFNSTQRFFFSEIFNVLAGNPTRGGISIYENYTNGLVTRFHNLWEILSGSTHNSAYGASVDNSIFPIFFIISFFFLIIYIIKTRSKKLIFITSLFALVFLLTPFTLSGLNAHHLRILLPLPQIIMAVFILSAYTSLSFIFRNKINTLDNKTTIIPKIILVSIFLLVFIPNFLGLYDVFHSLEKTGGVGVWSSANGDLAKWLIDNNYTQPILLDWGFHPPLVVYSEGKILPREIITYDNNRSLSESWFLETLETPNVYVAHEKEFTVIGKNWDRTYGIGQPFDILESINEILSEKNLRFEKIKTFNQLDGRPVISVYRVSPK